MKKGTGLYCTIACERKEFIKNHQYQCILISNTLVQLNQPTVNIELIQLFWDVYVTSVLQASIYVDMHVERLVLCLCVLFM